MEKLNMQTADAAEQNIRRIAGLFPGCVTETKDSDGRNLLDIYNETYPVAEEE